MQNTIKVATKSIRVANIHHLTKVYQLKFGFIENGIPTDYDNPPPKVVGIIPERTISHHLSIISPSIILLFWWLNHVKAIRICNQQGLQRDHRKRRHGDAVLNGHHHAWKAIRPIATGSSVTTDLRGEAENINIYIWYGNIWDMMIYSYRRYMKIWLDFFLILDINYEWAISRFTW